MAPRNVILFLGSIRPNRMVDRVLNFVKAEVEAKGFNVTIFDPLEMNFELLKVPLHFYPKDQAPAWLVEANEKIQKADAFLLISSEYNIGIPPALSNMLDHFPPTSFRHRPCGVVTYSMGSFGGIRVMSSIYQMINEFGMLCLPTNLNIPTVHTSITSEGKCSEERLSTKLTKLVDDLVWYTDAFANHKKQIPVPP